MATGPDDPPGKPAKPKDTSAYGSASRRAGRNVRRVKELPHPYIPLWFFEKNIVTRETLGERHNGVKEDLVPESTELETLTSKTFNDPQTPSSEQSSTKSSDPPTELPVNEFLSRHLKINPNVLGEVMSLVRAGLRVPDPQYAETVSSIKPHIVLCCPRNGASSYLAGFVEDIAARTSNTDFLRLTAQDIAEIGGDYVEEASPFQQNSLRSLGYDIAQVGATRPAPTPSEDSVEQDEYEDEDEDQGNQVPGRPFPPRQGGHEMNIIPTFVGTFSGIQDIFKSLKSPDGGTTESSGRSPKPSTGKPSLQLKEDTHDLKMGLFVEALLNGPEEKRSMRRVPLDTLEVAESGSTKATAIDSPTDPDTTDRMDEAREGPGGMIVLVEDYPLINMTINGGKFLDKLHDVVDSRRKEGQPVLIVGTASSRRILSSGEKSAIDDVQTQPWNGPIRTIVVPVKENMDGVMRAEQKRKIRMTNLRHLRDMLRRIAPVQDQVGSIIHDWGLSIESKWSFIGGLERSVWPLDRVNRIATIALGLLKNAESMQTQTIEKALGIIDASDIHKYGWLTKDKERKQKDMDNLQSHLDEVAPEDSESKMRKLRKKCNSYEKKLLNGVVDANNIRTTFADVQAPPETIDALKTLTSLSLVRPDAFTYGVLATDRIPGLLLYGPPGTGKTLLAKAVAKESGATVLEVSGSDVYDMYVGEGEKNVKAIFTLAKKLSPCIVFIDEADAILGTRSSGSSRTSHRELINQFLREWDGMTDMSAFIMVATNRPFDLDEASLRRLPRRLLVDLPVEKDREAILRIHLKDEIIDSEVSIPQLASRTPFYSGSDLKNLCVAAALACVREEFDAAMAHKKEVPDGTYQYAEKRTLHERHFTTGMEEISASISEDMGSLSAIRKFDEKYGDRRGRRKKLGGYGFKTVDDSEKLGSDAARVRNQS